MTSSHGTVTRDTRPDDVDADRPPRERAGEHLYRAGTNWTWGSVWTFEPGPAPRIGLYAHGGSQPPTVAQFDDVTISSATWPADG